MNEFSPGPRDERRPRRRDEGASEEDGAFQFDEALRRARREAAERARTAGGGRAGGRERPGHLLAALRPPLPPLPPRAEMVDIGVTPGFLRDGEETRPRLFLDMIGYVECAPEGGFRLAQSTRRGRVLLGEAEDVAGARRLVADYIARRLVEREEALSGDRTLEDAALRLVARERRDTALPRVADAPRDGAWTDEAAPRRETRAEAVRRAPLDPQDEDDPRPARRSPPRERARAGSHEADSAPRRDPALRGERGRASLSERLAPMRARWRRWTAPVRARRGGAMERGLVFAVQFLGSAALTLIVAMTAWWAWKAAGFVK